MNLAKTLSHIQNIDIKIDEQLDKYSTMRLKARGNLVIVKSVDSLKKIIGIFAQKKYSYRTLGLGANQLLSEKSLDTYIKLDLPFLRNYLDHPRDVYTLPASVNLSMLIAHAIKYGLKGWEVFTGIPATLGGAVFMNAGTGLGEIGSLIKKVRMIDRHGMKKEVFIKDDSFSYRKNNFTSPGDIIFEIDMIHRGFDQNIPKLIKTYLHKRNKTQPMKEKTCGCIFKNTPSCRAGHYIDIIGLKGMVYHAVRTSRIHGNFMENTGGANYSDALFLVENIRKELELQFGVSFPIEIKT
ncbi:MAG: FAD-binding protein [Halobacteriovoraceae bacterium]|nr:FAD-binding protein [Halobacteriovoraceae bacterium]